MKGELSCTVLNEKVEKQADKVLRSALTHQWSPRGVHLLLQTRTRVLNDELRQTFQQGYPGMQNEEVELKEAA